MTSDLCRIFKDAEASFLIDADGNDAGVGGVKRRV
jgi:hypothetical protein